MVNKRREDEARGKHETPQLRQLPETTPSRYANVVNEAWVVEGMMQIQKTLGELTATVSLLKSASEKQSTKLDRISHIIFAAGVVLTLLLSIGGFFLNKIWDGVFAMMKAGH
jgi:hypothetical protein